MSTSSTRRSTRPARSLLKSRMSSTRRARRSALRRMMERPSLCFSVGGSSGLVSMISAMPEMACRGVRSSCEVVARNSSFILSMTRRSSCAFSRAVWTCANRDASAVEKTRAIAKNPSIMIGSFP
ncbi:MAG: hypothetical protein BWY96_01159 [Spirochaetes bacterium ADurb.BinA120]|nr:MAG: hypothetical protein BWY96_01159 [Spirochaetes bacterium ADurb.BinA120]